MGTDDDRKDDPKTRRLHNAIAQVEWTYFEICKLPVVYCCEEMVSLLRKAITDLSAFDRQRKKLNSKPQQQTTSGKSDQFSPWTEGASASNPPPLEALFTKSSNGNVKRFCFNCEKKLPLGALS